MAVLKTANTKGKYYETHAKEDVIKYILNPYKAQNYCGTFGVNINNPAESMEMISSYYDKTSGVQLRHFVISFYPEEVDDAKTVNDIAKKFANFFFREYQVIYAVHEDKPHLHIHIVINSVSYIDGHRYYGTRAEFKSMEKYMKSVLRKYGIYRLDYVSVT